MTELNDALECVRTGDHDRARDHLLKADVHIPPSLVEDWPMTLAELERLRYVTLMSEIMEHDGTYKSAALLLARFKDAIAVAVAEKKNARAEDLDFGTRTLEWQILRQELYFTWQVSVSRYRDGDFRESERILDEAQRIAEKLNPKAEGLLTQLYYGAAKLAFHGTHFGHAIDMYRASLTSAAERVDESRQEKKPIESDRAAARYSIGKALALGLGQCLREQGRLAEAHTVVIAGKLLLDLTSDRALQNHARLLLGSIERGSAGETNPPLLNSARDHLDACVNYFDVHGGDSWFRAHYERALAKMQAHDLAEARSEIAELLKRAGNEDPPKTKWKANAQIALSRIERRDGRFDKAVEAASAAVDLSIKIPRIARRAHTTLAIGLCDLALSESPVDHKRLDKVDQQLKIATSALNDDDTRNRVTLLLVGAVSDWREATSPRRRGTTTNIERSATGWKVED